MKKKKIILVDDDQSILGLLRLVFKENGFEVRTARNGKELFRIIEKFVPNAILLDMMMPGMNGESICEKIREKKSFDQIKLFFLSVVVLSEDQLQTFEQKYKISGYFNKPFISENLLPAILKALKANPNPN